VSNVIELREHETSVMERGTMSPTSVLAHVAKVQEIMAKLLKDGEHYGTIPGTNKPTLLKPGAEKLTFTFRLLPKFRITKTDLPNGHREYELVCELWHESGVFAGEGVGSCSTMESKYRYRNAAKKCPQCGKETIIKGKEEYGGGWLCFAKKGGCGAKFPDNAPEIVSQPVGKVENTDIADTYNTVLKMAKKRALVDATITACAASDIFTQDVEDQVTSKEAYEDMKAQRLDAPKAPKDEGDSPLAARRDMEKEIGRLASLISPEAVTLARANLQTIHDMEKSGAINWDESVAKVKDILAQVMKDVPEEKELF
jgi:hypothetical protein